MAECWTFLPLRRRDGSVRAWTLIDSADAPVLGRWKWCLHSGGYAERRRRGKIVYLHRILLGLGTGDKRMADHRNGDRLDNRRRNLRIVPGSAANGQNRRGGGRGLSSHRGVTFNKRSGRWKAQVMLNRRNHNIGEYVTEHEAAHAASEFRREHMPYSSEAES